MEVLIMLDDSYFFAALSGDEADSIFTKQKNGFRISRRNSYRLHLQLSTNLGPELVFYGSW